jgi:hypothetical protein
MANLKSNKRNANYNLQKKDKDVARWGSTSFANLPEKPMYMGFSGEHDYRDGIINGFTCEISEMSGMPENAKYGDA